MGILGDITEQIIKSDLEIEKQNEISNCPLDVSKYDITVYHSSFGIEKNWEYRAEWNCPLFLERTNKLLLTANCITTKFNRMEILFDCELDTSYARCKLNITLNVLNKRGGCVTVLNHNTYPRLGNNDLMNDIISVYGLPYIERLLTDEVAFLDKIASQDRFRGHILSICC